MSQFPLYDLALDHPEPVSQMRAYLRDEGHTWEEIEVRRKSDIRQSLLSLRDGQHPFTTVLQILEATFGPKHPIDHLSELAKDPTSFDHYLGTKDKTPEEFQTERMEHIEGLIKDNFPARFHTVPFEADDRFLEWVDRMTAQIDKGQERSLLIAKSALNHLMTSRNRSTEKDLDGINRRLDGDIADEDEDNSIHPNDHFIGDNIINDLAAYNKRRTYEETRTRDKYQTQDDIEVRKSVEIIQILEEWKAGAHPLLVMSGVLDAVLGEFQNPLMDIIYHAQSNTEKERSLRKDNVSGNGRDENQLVQTMYSKKSITREARRILRSMNPQVLAYFSGENNPHSNAIRPITDKDFEVDFDDVETPFLDALRDGKDLEEVRKDLAEVKIEDDPSEDNDNEEADDVFAFAEQIDAYIEHINSADERSFSLVQGIAEAMFSSVEDESFTRRFGGASIAFDDDGSLAYDGMLTKDAPIITRIRNSLRGAQKEEDEWFEANKPMDGLHTETEKEAKASLSDLFRVRAKRQRRSRFKPYPKLTDEIHIDVSGSGMIKPFPGEDHKEDLYGTTTARITTYSVTLVAKDPSKTQELAGYVRWALKRIAESEPAFAIPFDHDSEPYKRPSTGSRYYGSSRLYENTYLNVSAEEGTVQVDTRLDLDDVWNLYYLLEDIIEPSEQIATAMNAARYAEERGVLMQKADMSDPYSNDNMKPEEQMGSLDQESSADYVPKTMEHTLYLYALGEIGEEQLLQRLLVLADHTLTGRMVDPDGLLPTFNRLTDQSSGDSTAVITYDDALKERTREILMVLTGTKDKERPLFPALIQRVAEISHPLRNRLRDMALQEEIRWRERFHRELRSGFGMGWDRLREDVQRYVDMLDEIEEKQKTNPEDEEKQKEMRGLAHKANIAIRSSEVGATTDRTWRGTEYVSRSGNSLWVRKELPKALQPFARTQSRPDMENALKAISYEAG